MSIEGKDIEYLSHLARLDLSQSQLDKVSARLGVVLEYMSKLQELNTINPAVKLNMDGNSDSFREDRVVERYKSDEILSYTDSLRGNTYFHVPKVIK